MNILVCAYKSEMQHKNAAYFLHHYHLTDKSDKKPFMTHMALLILYYLNAQWNNHHWKSLMDHTAHLSHNNTSKCSQFLYSLSTEIIALISILLPLSLFTPIVRRNSLLLCKAKRKKNQVHKLTLYTVFKCCISKRKVGTSWLDPHRISSRPHTARWSGRWWWRRPTPGRRLGRAGTPPSCSAGSWRL